MIKSLLMIAAVLAAVVSVAQAQAVFAHVIVGNNGAYTVQNWQSDMQLAASKGIDAFVLNICPNEDTTTSQTVRPPSSPAPIEVCGKR